MTLLEVEKRTLPAQFNDVTVRRSFKPDGFQQLKSVQLHHFSDPSALGYG